MHIREKPDVGWRVKTRRERSIPLVSELVAILRHVIGARQAGPVFVRERFAADKGPLVDATRKRMAQIFVRRVDDAERPSLAKPSTARLKRRSPVRSGAMRAPSRPTAFVCCLSAPPNLLALARRPVPRVLGISFATLLQDANVDLLIRQVTLGHASSRWGRRATPLGMTSIYTHLYPAQRRSEMNITRGTCNFGPIP